MKLSYFLPIQVISIHHIIGKLKGPVVAHRKLNLDPWIWTAPSSRVSSGSDIVPVGPDILQINCSNSDLDLRQRKLLSCCDNLTVQRN
ncbi:GSCOCG00013607001-RA-CDS [Cotesia congregata]|nr:GSCOCG00013607001-RA-CDS [Cotesia congregata]